MINSKKLYPFIAAGYALLPLIAGAQQLDTIIGNTRNTLQNIIGVLFIIATIVFLWGVIQFIASAGDETKRNKAKAVMTWGIIGLAVMAAAWGVAQVLIQYFGVGGQQIPPGPRQ